MSRRMILDLETTIVPDTPSATGIFLFNFTYLGTVGTDMSLGL